MHEVAQERIDLVVPLLAAEHTIMADAGLHVVDLAVGAHAGAEVLRRQRLAGRRLRAMQQICFGDNAEEL